MFIKRIKSLFSSFNTLLAILSLCSLASCSQNSDLESALVDSDRLFINGDCNIYEIADNKGEKWSITDAPKWITPVATEGNIGNAIRIYVESNSQGLREGTIVIAYGSGKTRSVSVSQSNEKSASSIQRTYAAGWSFDVRTYMDFRGLKEQIINTQKLNDYDDDMYRVESNKSSHIDFYYGESGSEMSDDMNAKLDIDGKFNSFSMDLQASFGKSALNNSKRIFSRIRASYQECVVYINQFDPIDAQDEELFTVDFADTRRKVIESNGSDEAIRLLIDHYGTHFVISASLGGFYDYFFSSVVENMNDLLNVEAAINLGFANKFKLEGDAKYKDDLEKLNKERIEKFAVKGGDAISLSMAVEDGSINQTTTDTWLKSLVDDCRYELLNFQLIPLSLFFPDDIADKINDYTDRMYYREIPVTRSESQN